MPHLPQPLKLPHHLQRILRDPPRLAKGQAPLDALQELSRDLVAHDMRGHALLMQLLARGTLVDTHHGDTDGPGTTRPPSAKKKTKTRNKAKMKEKTYALPILSLK